MSTSVVRVPIYGELKHNSGTFYQFSDYANSKVNNSMELCYYVALNLPDMSQTEVSKLDDISYDGLSLFGTKTTSLSNGINNFKHTSINSQYAELLQDYYETKCLTVAENVKTRKYFESYLWYTIFHLMCGKDINDFVIKDMTTQMSSGERVELTIPNGLIKFIGRVNATGVHTVGNKAFSDIYINIPAAIDPIGNKLPIFITQDDGMNDVDTFVYSENMNEIPYMTGYGVDNIQTIYDNKKAYFNDGNGGEYKGYHYYINKKTFLDGKVELPEAEIKNIITKNNIKIDYETLLNNISDYSARNKTNGTLGELTSTFNTIVLLGKDLATGEIIPAGIYFTSDRYVNSTTVKFTTTATKTNNKTTVSNEGTEYALKISAGVQISQNNPESYAYLGNSDNIILSGLTELSAEIAEMSSKFVGQVEAASNLRSNLATLLGNTYTTRRNVPRLREINTGSKKQYVWFVNGVNTGICSDGTLLNENNLKLNDVVNQYVNADDLVEPSVASSGYVDADNVEKHIDDMSYNIEYHTLDGTSKQISYVNIWMVNNDTFLDSNDIILDYTHIGMPSDVNDIELMMLSHVYMWNKYNEKYKEKYGKYYYTLSNNIYNIVVNYKLELDTINTNINVCFKVKFNLDENRFEPVYNSLPKYVLES